MQRSLSHTFVSLQSSELLFLENEVAGLGSRCLAYSIDLLVRGLTILALIYTAHPWSQPGGWAAVMSGLIGAVFVGYHVFCEAAFAGKTPGKLLVGIRVVKENGARISLLDALVRNLLRLVDMMPAGYLVGIVVMFLDNSSRRFGDIVAETLVIYDRPSHRDLRAYVDSQLISRTPSRSIAVQGVDRLSVAERHVVKELYDRMEHMEPDEKGRLLAKFSEQIVTKLRVSGATDPEVILYEIYRRL